ncbi:MAG: hypothetical protein R3B09_16030, partial [Nannocystaceae bacterium]
MNRRAAALGARGRATAQDLLAAIAALWTLSWILTTSTSILSGDLGTIPTIEAVGAPTIALALLLVVLAWGLPAGALTLASDRPRWRAPLYVLGFVALPLIFLLHFRRSLDRSPPERWLALPRWVAIRMAIAGVATIAAELPLLLAHWPLVRVVDHVILWLAQTCMTVVAAGLIARILARRELLKIPATTPVKRGRTPIDGGPLGALAIAAFGLAVTPMVVGHLWVDAEARANIEAEADALARQLVAAAVPGAEAELGLLLGEHPEVGVRTASGTLYGSAQDPLEAARDGAPPARVRIVQTNGALVAVPIPEQSPTSIVPFGLLALLCLGVAVGGAATLLRRYDEDARLLERRIDRLRGAALGDEDAPAPPTTVEWCDLASRLTQLHRRLDELEISRYLEIEAADLRDRRQVEHLAALAGELRSAHRDVAAAAPIDAPAEARFGAAMTGFAGILGPIADLSAILRGDAPLRSRVVSLTPILARAVGRARARRPELRIELRSAPGLPALHVDPVGAEEALAALLLFAAQRLDHAALIVRVEHDPIA